MAKPQTYAGASLSVSAAMPATYDATGFAALTYTDVGNVESLSTLGRVFTDVSYNTLQQRGTVHLKGTFDYEQTETVIIINEDDAGQILLRDAEKLDLQYSFKITFNDGSIKYFASLVWSYAEQGGDGNTIRKANVALSIDEKGLVEVAAP